MNDDFELVAFFTHQYCVTGTVRLGGQRLTDSLNDEFSSSVELWEVEVTRLLTPKKIVASVDSALVEKKGILFAISGAQSGDAAARRLFRHVDTTEWGVFLIVPSFELTGKFHVRGTSDLKTMLLRWTGQFIPLTEGKAVFTLLPEVTFTGDVIIVNRAHIEVICTDETVSI